MIYITGATGYLGRAVTAYLDKAGIKFQRCTADITRDGLKHIYLPPIETVIHLAGYINISLPSPATTGLGELYSVNVLGTANVLEFCLTRGVKNLVFASSQSVYGMPGARALTEATPPAPMEHYANSKYCAELLLQVAEGIDINVLRIAGIYSEDRQAGLVHDFCRQARSGHIEVTGDKIPLDIIHIDDVVQAIYQTINHRAGYSCFNIATGEPCSLSILADTIARIAGCSVTHNEVTQPVVQLDVERAKKRLGWQAESLESRLAAYYYAEKYL